MKYLAVLGRLPKISLAELEAQFGETVRQIAPSLAVFEAPAPGEAGSPEINRFGGVMKFAALISENPIDYLQKIHPTGKFVLGVSDYTKKATARGASAEAMRIKKIQHRCGRSVRVLANDKNGFLSTAAVHHNQLGEKPGHIELVHLGKEWYHGYGVQNITAYARRDQARPARDAKVGMLPPKLAQILINLCGPLPESAKILDPFCGTGVVLQEALLMGYLPFGSDASARMIGYTEKNLTWLLNGAYSLHFPAVSLHAQKLHPQINLKQQLSVADATNAKWPQIDAVACETYLGSPMSKPPVDIKLKTEKIECKSIIMGFLKNIQPQLRSGTPLAIAVPAWLRPDGSYSHLDLLDEINEVGYNVVKFRGLTQEDLLYYRDGQVVAREIIVLKVK